LSVSFSGVGVSFPSSVSGQSRVCGGSALAHFLRQFAAGELGLKEAAQHTGLMEVTLRLYLASPLTRACRSTANGNE
jgi:hypothetical protein